jgi:hypothetical protein
MLTLPFGILGERADRFLLLRCRYFGIMLAIHAGGAMILPKGDGVYSACSLIKNKEIR